LPPLLPIILEILPAVLLSAVVMLLGDRLAPPARGRVPVWPALAIGGGYLAGHFAMRGWRGWAPKESTDWIAVCAAVGLLVGLLGWSRNAVAARAFMLRWIVGAVVAWLVVGKVLLRGESAALAWGQMALIGLAAAFVWSQLETHAVTAGVGLAALLCLVATGSSVALALSNSAVLGQLAGGLAAALGAAIGARVLMRAPLQIRAAVPAFSATLLALLSAGVVYSRLPLAAAMLLGAAPLAVALAHAPGARRLPRAMHLAGPILLALLPVVLALLLANASAPAWDDY
jgi:hypothetical protein